MTPATARPREINANSDTDRRGHDWRTRERQVHFAQSCTESMYDPEILLTNDDGIDAAGHRALYDALTNVGSVTAVAPATDQSAVGRTLSYSLAVREHELGYEIDGTPGDCVIAGLSELVPDADLVVAGCNRGANLGTAVLGRSGTVSAAVEATFFDLPAIAVSTYVPTGEYTSGDKLALPREQYAEAVSAAAFLIDNAEADELFEYADYLNLNAPVSDDARGEMAVTVPSRSYHMTATQAGDEIELQNKAWGLMSDGALSDEPGTDRRAVLDGLTSVSPLTAPHTVEEATALGTLAEAYA